MKIKILVFAFAAAITNFHPSQGCSLTPSEGESYEEIYICRNDLDGVALLQNRINKEIPSKIVLPGLYKIDENWFLGIFSDGCIVYNIDSDDILIEYAYALWNLKKKSLKIAVELSSMKGISCAGNVDLSSSNLRIVASGNVNKSQFVVKIRERELTVYLDKAETPHLFSDSQLNNTTIFHPTPFMDTQDEKTKDLINAISGDKQRSKNGYILRLLKVQKTSHDETNNENSLENFSCQLL
ncbi:hypothetical protein ACFLY6_02730 [Candidatus Dependentiae bacterium]